MSVQAGAPGTQSDSGKTINMKISVISAVYNNRYTIARALDSGMAQTPPDVELGVTDGTLAIGFADKARLQVCERVCAVVAGQLEKLYILHLNFLRPENRASSSGGCEWRPKSISRG